MKTRREETTLYIEELLSLFNGNNDSVKVVIDSLNDMSDKEFSDYMKALKNKETYLRYTQPNLEKNCITLDKILKAGDKIGHDFFKRCWFTDGKSGVTTLSPIKRMIVDIPFRRQQQHLLKKIAIATHHRNIDDTTGQVVGSDSKASSLSAPELEVMRSHGLMNSIKELGIVRGGDEKLYRKLLNYSFATGDLSVSAVDDGTTRVKSTVSLSTYLKAAHLGNNL